MAARNWTPEQRARQAAIIHGWQPWKHSTGARTPDGKARSSRNAFRYTHRKGFIFARWLARQANNLRTGKPYASMIEVQHRARLCGVNFRES